MDHPEQIVIGSKTIIAPTIKNDLIDIGSKKS